MIKATIDSSALNELLERIAKSPDVLKEAKRRAFETASLQMKQALNREIGGTGKVQSWQEAYVGSKGGYAAVRPRAKTYAEDSRGRKTKYPVGYVTNAINSGHRFPGQGVSGKRKKRQASTAGSVPGKRFYEAAQSDMGKIAQEAAGQIVDTLVKHLEG